MFRSIALQRATTAFKKYKMMSTFASQFNPLLGKNEWVLQDENYDYHQEIARSAYADMLHDTERNQKYYAALKKAIKKKRDNNEPVNVLDIGTGTGLLSMMAASIGADSITACEAFKPMAECALKVIKENGFHDKIRLIPKRSTDVTVGVGKDMPQKANILVTEVFDTELIGEGAIGTYTHALENLLEPNCSVVPHSARIHVQLAQSALGKSWNEIQPIHIEGVPPIEVPSETKTCSGALTLHDLQLNQISRSDFQPMSEPQKVFDFDFSGKKKLVFNQTVVSQMEAKSSGSVDVIFMWWDLDMDEEGEILLSCAPYWAHPERREVQWRDHWMQAIYYPSQSIEVQEGEQINLTSSHDEYSLWFDVNTEQPKPSDDIERPVCTCGVHQTYGRTRLGMINDTERNQIYIKELQKVVTEQTICLCLSDGSLLPLIAARLGAQKVYVLEPSDSANRTLKSFIKYNQLEDVITIIKKTPINFTSEDCEAMQINLVIGEPYFQSSILPWHNLHFWYLLSELPKNSLTYLPDSMKIFAVAMEFKDLCKIRSPVDNCEGFCLREFDDMIADSSNRADQTVEAEPLWEYPGYALSEPMELLSFDVSSVQADTNIRWQKFLTSKRDGICNGVAFWVEYKFGDSVISTGMKNSESYSPDNYVTWDRHTRQGVHLLKEPISVSSDSEIPLGLTFHSKSGQILVDFTTQSARKTIAEN